MATWESWTPDLALSVPGCPAPTMERAVRQTVTDFLERTHWLQRTVGGINVSAGAGAQAFGVPLIASGEKVLAVLRAWLLDDPLDVYGVDDVEDENPDWQTLTGSPTAIVLERIDAYHIFPAPTDAMAAALRVRAAIGLTETATACDDLIRSEWRDAITDGSKARLLAEPEQQWTDLKMAAVWQSSYMSAVNGAIVRVARTPARRPLRTTPVWF